jgi:DnaJ like chaperone protein
MYIFGKIFGAVFGSLIAGPIGFAIGIGVGHLFDKGLDINARFTPNVAFAQKVFFKTTFTVLGYIAKIDGRVSESEIQVARAVMAHLQLNADQKLLAIQYFNLGKSPEFNFETAMDNFVKNCGYHSQLIQLFVEIQIQGALVDGLQNTAKKQVLERLCDRLNIPPIILAQMESPFYSKQYNNESSQKTRLSQSELIISYGLLGVNDKATDEQVKKAYRQLMSQHHPDKLVAKGLPEEMIKIATEKTQRIQKAYELVSKSRGMK